MIIAKPIESKTQGAAVNQTMTIQEIEDRFPSEWILVGDPVTNDALEVMSGTVLWHSPDRDEVYRKAIELRPKRSAFLNTKKIPEGSVIVL
jgi:hypothetical protein